MKKIILCVCIFVISTVVYGNDLSSYQNELDKIKRQQEQTAQNLTGVEKEIAEDMYDLIELDAEVAKYTTKLNELNEKVEIATEELEKQEKILQNASQSYNAAEEMYITRLKVIYENGVPSVIDILFSSSGITDFFSKLNVLNSILEYDKKIIDNMDSQKEYVASVSKNIEVQKVQLETLQYDAEKSAESLKYAVEQKQNKLDDLESQKDSLNEKATLLKSMEAEAKKKVDEELQKLASQASQFSGVFTGEYTWVTPASYNLTAVFDERLYRSLLGFAHTGIDIGVSSGNSVLAAADGKVVRTRYNNGGYGFYVVIDHGVRDGYKYMTLYGHNSNILVNEGDTVSKGQKIALSGNTGNSTGAHLHFEINKALNGAMWSMDPMLFYQGTGAPFKYYSESGLINYPFSNISAYQYSSQLRRSFSF